MVRRVVPLLLCLGIVFLLSIGCESKEPPSYSISGTVTLDGAPQPDGEVYFILPGQVPTIFPIEAGNFAGKARAGTHRVEICAYRARTKPVGMPNQKMSVPPENYIPPQFNSQSKLIAEVQSSGSNQFKYEVQRK